MNRHGSRPGAVAEEIAADRLQKDGWKILERNFRTRQGELDLIGRTEGLVVFVEVKSSLTSSRRGPVRPSHAVDFNKQVQVRRIATEWLARTALPRPCAGFRFDVIGVTLDRSGYVVEYEHLPGAF